ncbi:nitroreductase family protein [Spirochaetota bacterium]
MNPVIKLLHERKSVRSYLEKPISEQDQNSIIDAAIQAPSAGNQLLYTILHIKDQELKEKLAVLCDNQPFIAKAPFVLIFLADCRKWLDGYKYAGIEAREPGLGDILLASADAFIAAQNAVIAAESLGLGSCYIGDILENKEHISELLNLDKYVLPAVMLVFGYPSKQQLERKKPKRFDKKYIVQKNKYSRMSKNQIMEMFDDIHKEEGYEFKKYMKAFCTRKYMSDFALEMNRSVKEYLSNF